MSRSVSVAVSAAIILLSANSQADVLTLGDALNIALERAPAVLNELGTIAEAREHLRSAAVRLTDNPEIGLALGSRRWNRMHTTDREFAVSQRLGSRGSRTARIQIASADLTRVTADLAETRRIVLEAVATQFFAALKSKQRVELLRRAEALAEESRTVAKRRVEAGDATDLDANLTKVALSRARAARIGAEADRVAALGSLRILLGPGSGSVDDVDGSLTPVALANRTDLMTRARERADLQSLRAEIAATDGELALALSKQRPESSVRMSYATEESADITSVGWVIALPVPNRWAGEIAAVRARRTRLLQEQAALEHAVVVEVDNALEAAIARRAAAEELRANALPSLAENERLVLRMYEEGEVGLVDLLLVRQTVVETGEEFLDQLADAALASFKVNIVAGVMQ